MLPRRMPLAEAERLVERSMPTGSTATSRASPTAGAARGRALRWARGACSRSPASPAASRRWTASADRPGRGRVEVVPGGLRRAARSRWPRHRRAARGLAAGTGAEVIAERVAARASNWACEPGRITIRDQSSRWASASASGALSFSWRLILAPPFVLDAVVVHELAHLRIRGHTRRFWALVERHAPRTPEARRWLREHAREVRAALD